jgi:hypothetical protein
MFLFKGEKDITSVYHSTVAYAEELITKTKVFFHI